MSIKPEMRAPWSPEQVENLRKFQSCGWVHQFTCCRGDESTPSCKRRESARLRFDEGKEVPYTDENEGVLIPTEDGWLCPCGEYRQNWAHESMIQGLLPPNPQEWLDQKIQEQKEKEGISE